MWIIYPPQHLTTNEGYQNDSIDFDAEISIRLSSDFLIDLFKIAL